MGHGRRRRFLGQQLWLWLVPSKAGEGSFLFLFLKGWRLAFVFCFFGGAAPLENMLLCGEVPSNSRTCCASRREEATGRLRRWPNRRVDPFLEVAPAESVRTTLTPWETMIFWYLEGNEN